MAQRKPAEDTRTQRRKFIDAAREHGAETDRDAFRIIVHQVATAKQPKKASLLDRPSPAGRWAQGVDP